MPNKAVHAAYIAEDGETFWFASLDGENWLGVSRDPTGADPAQLQALIDGNGQFRPMMTARRFLVHKRATFLAS